MHMQNTNAAPLQAFCKLCLQRQIQWDRAARPPTCTPRLIARCTIALRTFVPLGVVGVSVKHSLELGNVICLDGFGKRLFVACSVDEVTAKPCLLLSSYH